MWNVPQLRMLMEKSCCGRAHVLGRGWLSDRDQPPFQNISQCKQESHLVGVVMAGVSVEADNRAVVRESAESVGRGSVPTPGDGGVEPVRKGTQNCYKTKDKKGRQEDLFPMLQAEINS